MSEHSDLNKGPEEQRLQLRGHDQEILSFLEGEELVNFSFDGLQRSLQLHPETLTRSLTRLEEEGLIQKEPEGYHITSRLRGAHPAHLQLPRLNVIALAQTLLPTYTNPANLLTQLRGRWFGRLRWLGYSKKSNETTLKWVTEDGRVRLYAKLEGPMLSIQAALQEDVNVDEAVQVSHQLLSQLSNLYSQLPHARVASYVIFPAVAAAM